MSQNVPENVFARLNASQQKAAEVLVAGGDKAKAAKAAGVTKRTINRYMNDPTFCLALDKATGAALGTVARRLIGGMETAVSTMLTLVEDKKTPPTVKLRACIAILEHGPKLFEVHDLAKRIEKLEEALHGK